MEKLVAALIAIAGPTVWDPEVFASCPNENPNENPCKTLSESLDEEAWKDSENLWFGESSAQEARNKAWNDSPHAQDER